MTVLYVNADWSAIVPAGSVEAAFGIDVETATRLGLLDGTTPPEPVTLHTTNEPAIPEAAVEPEDEAPVDQKQDPKPADKQAPKPADKALHQTKYKRTPR